MARLKLSPPPTFKSKKARYDRYRPWLRANFLQRSCGYCLVALIAGPIDHYEPQEFRADRVNDPTNLILACPSCNGSKLDYHPNHATRRCGKNGRFLVIDVRNEDYSEFFSLEADGTLLAKPGEAERFNRAVFCQALLDLNHDDKRSRRRDFVDALGALIEFKKSGKPIDRTTARVLKVIEKTILDFLVLRVALNQAVPD